MLQQKINAIEQQNLIKKYEFISQRISQIRKQNALLNSEISRLKDQNCFLNKINAEMVKKLASQDKTVNQKQQQLKKNESQNNTKTKEQGDNLQNDQYRKIISKIKRLSDYQLRLEVEKIVTNEEYFFQDNNIVFDKKQTPILKVHFSNSEKKFQNVKGLMKNLTNICHRISQSTEGFIDSINEFCAQIEQSYGIFKDNKEIALLIKYTKQLLKQATQISSNLVQGLETTFVIPITTFYKNQFEKYKDIKKKNQKQQQQFQNFLSKLPTMKRSTPLMTYSTLLKNYFLQNQTSQTTRIATIESYNTLSININEELIQGFLNMLTVYKNMFNQYRQLTEELEDVTGFLGSIKLRKKEIKQLASQKIIQMKNKNSYDVVPSEDKILSKEGYLFSKTTKDFKRKYYKIEMGKLYKLKPDKSKTVIVKKQIVALELGNLKQSNQSQNINSFELSSPAMKKSIIFVAETEFQYKQWCNAIKNNIELSISNKKQVVEVSESEEKQTKKKSQTSQKLTKVNICADCSQNNPSWISVSFYVIICLQCSGYHRKLGTISKVRSLKLDFNDQKLIEIFQKYGNQYINKIWEGKIGQLKKPNSNSDSKDRQNWIRMKYIEKKFIDLERLQQCPQLKSNLQKIEMKEKESQKSQ